MLQTWELASTKTGGYLYSRALLALLSTLFHWIVFQSVGTAAPIALALWVGIVSQFLPVVGTYIAGVLPVILTFLDSPLKALIVLIAIVVYQQIENYVFAPRITARTMQLHPALAFGSALAGAALLGAVGAVLALPAAAMAQALVSELGTRHHVVDSHLTDGRRAGRRRRRLGYWFGFDDDQTAAPPRLAEALMRVGAVVPIAETTRNGVVESVHFGAVVVVAADGSSRGRPAIPTPTVYPRSALKPLQAQAMVDAGFDADARRACRRRCEPQRRADAPRGRPRASCARPGSTRTPWATRRRCRSAPARAADVLRAGGRASPMLQNCSGKHAAMLATCVANGWDVDDYLDVDHPGAEVDRRVHRRGGRRRRATPASTAAVRRRRWSR